MKVLRIILKTVLTVFLMTGMFFCFISGAPSSGGDRMIYIIFAAGFCIVLAVFVNGCLIYIKLLRKRIKELETDIDIFMNHSHKLDK